MIVVNGYHDYYCYHCYSFSSCYYFFNISLEVSLASHTNTFIKHGSHTLSTGCSTATPIHYSVYLTTFAPRANQENCVSRVVSTAVYKSSVIGLAQLCRWASALLSRLSISSQVSCGWWRAKFISLLFVRVLIVGRAS